MTAESQADGDAGLARRRERGLGAVALPQLREYAATYAASNRRDNRDLDGRASAAVADFLGYVQDRLERPVIS